MTRQNKTLNTNISQVFFIVLVVISFVVFHLVQHNILQTVPPGTCTLTAVFGLDLETTQVAE